MGTKQLSRRLLIIFPIVILLLFIRGVNLFGAITVVASDGNEDWAVGTKHVISWTWTGTIDFVNIYYSPDDFTVVTNTIQTSLANSGSYEWTIPDDIWQNFILKVKVADAASPADYDVSVNPFKIKADISVITPTDNTRWVINEQHDIVWTTTGTVPLVTLQYSIDNFVTISTIITTANTGIYYWKIPNAYSFNAKVRVCDSRDLTAYGESPNTFKIDYYYVTFNVRDDVTRADLSALYFRYYDPDQMREYTRFPIKSPYTQGFTYNSYTIIIWKTLYLEASVDFIADRDRTYVIYLESSVVHNWGVMADFNYDNTNDDLYVTSWLLRDGLLFMADAENVTIDFYDSYGALIKTLLTNVKSPDGFFRMTWLDTGLFPNITYTAKVQIVYAGKPFNSALTLTIESGTVIAYQLMAYFNLDTTANRLESTAWLMLDGLMIPNPDSITIDIHNQAGVLIKTLSSSTPDTDGVFRTNWDNPGLDPQQTYMAYVTVIYAGKPVRNIFAYNITSSAPPPDPPPDPPPISEPPQTGSSGESKESNGVRWLPGRCGLLGFEVIILMGTLLLIKRKSLKTAQ